MPTFHVKAVTSRGQKVEEKIEAASQADVMLEMEKRGLIPLEVKPVSQLSSLLVNKKVSKKELALFCKQLSYLTGTGIPLHRGVEIIGEQVKNQYFKSIIEKIIQDIKEGIPLSQAVGKHPNVFPDSMTFQLKAAESGGFMQESLMSIATAFERDADFNSKIRGAMVYPIVVLIVAFGIVYFMLTSVVPSMADTLTSLDAELPALTQMVMKASDVAKNYWYVLILIIGGLVFLGYTLLQDEGRRKAADILLLKIPVLGKLILSVNIARMTRVMSSLLSSGVPIDDTLDNLIKVISNKAISDEIRQVKKDILEQGISLSKSFETKPVFPKTMVQVVSVGEESGNLPNVLNNLAENLEEEVSTLLKTVTSLINPLLMIVIGAIIAVIILSLFLPMFSIIDQL